MTKVGTGTSPAGSQWARQPVPGCKDNHGFKDDCGADGTEYPAPLPGLQGFGYVNSTKQGSVCPSKGGEGCSLSSPLSPIAITRMHMHAHKQIDAHGGGTVHPISVFSQRCTLYHSTCADVRNSDDVITQHYTLQPKGDLYHDFSIVDTVVVPKDVAPGAYLVSWRWDCEQTTQIWQNCADIVIV